MKYKLLFIGMPSSGKTTVGRRTAELLGFPFFDFDEIIETRTGMTVRRIFAERGAEEFRKTERELASEFGELEGAVISPGGGIVESEQAMERLCKNAVVIRLVRDLSLTVTEGRPLLAKPGALEEIFRRRDPLYTKYAMVTLENNGSVEQCAEAAAREYERLAARCV